MTIRELYYGDNLQVLREQIPDESVDLIYLDPPFNSQRDYNLLFRTSSGEPSNAQIVAFQDSWHWGEQAETEFDYILKQPNTQVASMIGAILGFLGRNDMTAYIVMMTSRLLELRRVLKPTGSLYLHCDPTASHYLKITLDAVFGKENYRTEISWRRSSAHNDARQGRIQYGNIRDVIFFYTKSSEWNWNWQYTPYSKEYVEKNYNHKDENGRRFRLDNLTAAKGGGDTSYEFHGTYPYKGRFWAYSKENMEKMLSEGRLYFPPNGGTPAYIRYLDEMPGVPLQNDWGDILPAPRGEDLGYPTQKPLALLERIIKASSNEGDVVLDPFCGCGTAVHAAESLNRQWIGIDVTHLAISLIEKRLRDAFAGIKCAVHGTPKDLDSARDLAKRDKYQFQWWACSLVNAQPFGGQKKGADTGIDGVIFFRDDYKGGPKKIIVSVKGGDNINVGMVRDLKGVLEREKAAMGIFVCLASPTKPMITEAAAAGLYQSYGERRYNRIQILTIEDLFSGKKAEYYDVTAGQATFKKAAVTEKKPNKTLLDDLGPE